MPDKQDLMQEQEELFDVTIVGGGPTGLFAAFYAGVRDMKTKIIDSLPQLGGQLAELYPEKYIYDVGGFPKVRAKELVERLVEQAFQYHPEVCLNEQVQELRKREDGVFELHTNHRVHLSRAVLITAGIGSFTPRPLPVDGAAAYEGRGIYYYIDNLEKFRGQSVLVIGGGDSAVDFALMLEPVAKRVVLIHRRDQFRAHEDSVKKLLASRVEVKTFFELKGIRGDDALTGATIVHNKTGEAQDLDVQSIISGLGFSASLGPILNWGLEMEDNSIVVNTRMETNIPGVYAAGDIVTYPGKLKLIATGFGEAPTAINNAKTYLDPKARLFPGHSSNRKE
ncbi:MAG: NAD(P)/FAD-dependent oxidoreductase [Kyrpidia sp.]|nr:NAD(P)/FAD-dependent oxidoreductase [Kyrpidia sp.]